MSKGGELRKILIVDDTPLNLNMLAALLTGTGYLPIQATSGGKARQLAVEQTPDLILLDMMMPVEDGLSCCRLLKQDPRSADIPVIFLSALDDSGTKVEGLALGAVDYITKPFNQEEVLQRIKLHLDLRDRYRSLARRQADMVDGLRRAQQDMLVRPEEMPRAGFAVCYRPTRVVGGVFFDVLPLPGNCHDFFVADIGGGDLAASFNSSAIKALFRQSALAAASPLDTMRRIDNGVIRVFADGIHLTACLLHLDRTNSLATCVNTGHLPFIHVRRATGAAALVKARGNIHGASDEPVPSEQTVAVELGDRLFLYTGGLPETRDKSRGRDRGIDVLAGLCAASRLLPLGEAVTAICDRLFPDSQAARDDVILLGIEV